MASDDDTTESAQTTRRGIMAALLAAVGLGGFYAGSATADDGSASGQVGTSAEPALHIYTESVVFHERTSDPSSPDDGTMWYNSSG